MPDMAPPYCVATVVREFEPLTEAITSLGSFEDVVVHLRATHSWFADRMADCRSEDDSPDAVPDGGGGVQLRNRWGSMVEVGVGREVWFLFRHAPEPSLCYSDRPPLDGYLAFWLGGWHHTELGRDMLVSRACVLKVSASGWIQTPFRERSEQT